MIRVLYILILSFTCVLQTAAQAKREFRGAWIQCVNGQFRGMPTADMQQTLTYQLDELQKDGCNAIIFQVRPECDALYESSIEPWSYFLTGRQGTAPSPYWDPLKWMIEQCHSRGMELHAWINPYRAKTKVAHEVSSKHVVSTHPEWTMLYDGLTLLNPALQESRDYICEVVADIVSRYDIDGLHMDDYFYPYPTAGCDIPDSTFFMADRRKFSDIGDWRRDNVSRFVRQMAETVHKIKPWVKVGISPFGIYRNKKNWPEGSRTNGLQNYDQLYADILLWDRKGWMDYCVPQLYWEIGHKAADYEELIGWWNDNIERSLLFIGEDVERTVKYADRNNPSRHQMAAKMSLHDQMQNVDGTVLWYAKAAVDNVGNYGSLLRSTYWNKPALQPIAERHARLRTPGKPRKLKVLAIDGKQILFWTPARHRDWRDEATAFAVYRFGRKESIDLTADSCLQCITANAYHPLDQSQPGQYTYVVVPLNRIQASGKTSKIKVSIK